MRGKHKRSHNTGVPGNDFVDAPDDGPYVVNERIGGRVRRRRLKEDANLEMPAAKHDGLCNSFIFEQN